MHGFLDIAAAVDPNHTLPYLEVEFSEGHMHACPYMAYPRDVYWASKHIKTSDLKEVGPENQSRELSGHIQSRAFNTLSLLSKHLDYKLM